MAIPRIFLVISLFLCSLLYLSSNHLDGWYSLAEVIALSGISYAVVECIRRYAEKISGQSLLRVLVSIVLGLGIATFIVMCCKQLYSTFSLLPIIELPLLFLLPIAGIALIYTVFPSINFSLFPAQGSGQAQMRSFVPDASALEDGRILDLARAGLFDGQIVVPSFLPLELRFQTENGDDNSRNRARKALDVLRKLETLPRFTVHVKDVSMADTGDLNERLLLAAKKLEATLLTNESPISKQEGDVPNFLSVDAIASALKPSIPKGEALSIKIQRLGKEPKQGIGYLEDGTMVVVNGGGDYLGRNVRTQVLSQKYSSSGKIVFCNVREEDDMMYSAADSSY